MAEHAASESTSVDSAQHEEQVYTFDQALKDLNAGRAQDEVVSTLLSHFTKDEKLSLLDGDTPFWPGMRSIFFDRYNRTPYLMGAVPRLRIPGIRFSDGPRGIVMGASTCFPISMARGASWDTSLERRIGDAIGREGRSQGANLFAGICINLPRHPAWGRIQETYGEDSLILGEFGVALHSGVQPYMMTCVKHYALNSMEIARFKVDVQIDEAALHEVYLPHFRRLIEAGVDSAMSSYNSVRGEYAGQNYELLTEILRSQWKFDGFVMTDFIFGLRDAALSLKNGQDIEAPFSQQRARDLPDALTVGKVDWSHVDTACTRILRTQLKHVVTLGSPVPDGSVINCDEHKALAREAAAKGMVLLKNAAINDKPLLPLDCKTVNKVALVGRLADKANTGDHGSSAVFPTHVVTAYEGLRAALTGVEVILEDTDDVEKARKIASEVDLVICIVGYDAGDEGEYVVPSFKDDAELLKVFPTPQNYEDREVAAIMQGGDTTGEMLKGDGIVPNAGGDRTSLRLHDNDVELISAVSAAKTRAIVSIVAAGALIMEEWIDKVPAVLMSWYSGEQGGNALADVLLGKIDASGRLPFSIPTSENHLPFFDAQASSITYDQWHGQRLLDKLGQPARFSLGFGLSYTEFETKDLSANTSPHRSGEEAILVRANVRNSGTRKGRYIAQVYGKTDIEDVFTRVLLGFQPVDLEVGQASDVEIHCSTRPLQKWKEGSFHLPAQKLELELASFAGDENALRTTVSIW